MTTDSSSPAPDAPDQAASEAPSKGGASGRRRSSTSSTASSPTTGSSRKAGGSGSRTTAARKSTPSSGTASGDSNATATDAPQSPPRAAADAGRTRRAASAVSDETRYGEGAPPRDGRGMSVTPPKPWETGGSKKKDDTGASDERRVLVRTPAALKDRVDGALAFLGSIDEEQAATSDAAAPVYSLQDAGCMGLHMWVSEIEATFNGGRSFRAPSKPRRAPGRG